jgi:hypothetical protein
LKSFVDFLVGDFAAQSAHNFGRQKETQPHPRLLGGGKWLEEPLAHRGQHSTARVFHPNHHLVLLFVTLSFDHGSSTIARRVKGVRNQIINDLAEPLAIYAEAAVQRWRLAKFESGILTCRS